jgi:hypothetical protein
VSTCDAGNESTSDVNVMDKGAMFSKLKFVNVELSGVENCAEVSVADISDHCKKLNKFLTMCKGHHNIG